MSLRTIMVSLTSPVGLLRGIFQDYVQLQMQHNNTQGVQFLVGKGALDYSAGEVMRHMVREIFDTDTVSLGLPQSTLTLMSDGMDEVTAKATALRVFRATIDCIARALNGISFGSMNNNFTCDFVGEYDLMISFDDRNLEPE